MKALTVTINDKGKVYLCLAFVCPGCVEMMGGSGLHLLPVNSEVKSPAWNWDGNLADPTLSPSILTGKGTKQICHSFLKNGTFEFLTDSKHSLAGQKVPMPELPDWFHEEAQNHAECKDCSQPDGGLNG